MQWYDYIFWVVAFIIIVLGLLQGGKSEGASGAITGGGLNVFVKTKERGSELIISYLTLGFGILFLFLALLTTSLIEAPVEDTPTDPEAPEQAAQAAMACINYIRCMF